MSEVIITEVSSDSFIVSVELSGEELAKQYAEEALGYRDEADLDAAATAADRVQTGLDAAATAADRVQTGLDAAATAADRVQTGLDAAATAADRVQTGLDVLNTEAIFTNTQSLLLNFFDDAIIALNSRIVADGGIVVIKLRFVQQELDEIYAL